MEKSLKVAIVDDLAEDSQRLADYLERFQKEHDIEIQMDVYNASFEFLEKYHGNYFCGGSRLCHTAHVFRIVQNGTLFAEYSIWDFTGPYCPCVCYPLWYFSSGSGVRLFYRSKRKSEEK